MSDVSVSATSTRDERAAIDKAFSLLQVLHEAGPDGAGVSALARRSDLSKSTAFRVLSRLEHNGAVERVGTSYRIGSAIRRLGRSEHTTSSEVIREVVTPFLVDLHAATGATAHLAVLDGAHVLYVNKINGHRAPATRARIGHVAPAHCTSVGKVLLAARDELVEHVIAGGLTRRTARTITRGSDLRAELARVRADGVAIDDQEAMPGLSCAGVGLSGSGPMPLAAISLADAADADWGRHIDVLRRVRLEANVALAQGIARLRAQSRPGRPVLTSV